MLLKPSVINWSPSLFSLRPSYFLTKEPKRKQCFPGRPFPLDLLTEMEKTISKSPVSPSLPQPLDQLSWTHIWELIRWFCLWNLQRLHCPILAQAVSVGNLLEQLLMVCLPRPFRAGEVSKVYHLASCLTHRKILRCLGAQEINHGGGVRQQLL